MLSLLTLSQVEVVGMNAGLMAEYIRYVADRLLVALGYAKLYNAANPFDWMEMISLQVRRGVISNNTDMLRLCW